MSHQGRIVIILDRFKIVCDVAGLAFGGLEIDGLGTDIEEIHQNYLELVSLQHQLFEVRNQRDALYLSA